MGWGGGAVGKEKGEPSYEAGFSLAVIACCVGIVYTENLLTISNV
tara:strand:- start:1127 stop:1261 length:135 start_codon:yes stop_codon:yes gene_type:complete